MKRELTYLITILIAISMVLACGDGGGGKKKPPGIGPQGEAIGVTCADLVQSYGESCDAVRMDTPLANKPGRSALFDIGNAAAAIFNSGELIWNAPLITEMEIDNYTTSFQRFYLYWDYSHIKGCESLNKRKWTYPLDINPMVTLNYGSSGTEFKTCANKNDLGSFVTVTLYNASHLGDDELGDINVDQVLFNTTIHFTLVNSIAFP